ncbi:hypothetical protein HY212_02230 [Candidatus Pacearchaeota archaeon]|nr:hypothetical protein [Candidatus Pacearchaeota archaeon]
MIKTSDGRIIDKRVVIDRTILKKLILEIKEKKKLSWKEFAYSLGVVEHTLKHDWINKGNTIPQSIFKILLKMANKNTKSFEDIIKIREPFWGQKLNKNVKIVRLPNIKTKEFAEFYGIMLGDGCITSNLKGFIITGDKIFENNYYHKYLSSLIYDLFGYKPKIIESKNERVIRAIFYSKKACKFIEEKGFPKGLKSSGKLEIPKFIAKDKLLLSYCLRGIMDTDGSLAPHPHSKVMIHLSIPNKNLRSSVLQGLRRLDIEPGEFSKGIMLYGSTKIADFKRKIGFSNYKNILKYNKFIETGKVPNFQETEMFLRDK